ncbi:galactokinase [Ktedonosporobacter rubrisoli]|uniref:Galactokinase n=1 Tax=Ktedonosporobacter rubrisoli TaxID=2509675 RepID=A0A4P6JSC3_KTERU|nr:galactokinase [Ktedonosporobacter rubrisoli]QBD78223.1 galactokinase [Ktedonosporobacter rubrisoli]
MTRFPQPVQDAAEKFSVVFHDAVAYEGALGGAWAPGRVNLIGEHTDYNEGFVLPLAVDRVAAFAGRVRNDGVVRLWSVHFNEYAQFSLADLPESFEQQRAMLPGWARYILGVVTELIQARVSIKGFDAVVGGDVPLGGGMSSSAALEVATAYACSLFSAGNFTIGADGAAFTPLQIAALCQQAEHRASGLRSGILDQAASCLGKPGKAILLDCRSLGYRYLPFDRPELSLMVIDTSVRRELAASAYNERRSQCEEATRLLRELIVQNEPAHKEASEIKSLRDISQAQFEHYKSYLPAILQQRAGYIIAENKRVLRVAELLEQGNVEAVGPLLWQGHAGLRDEYEVSCTELDVLVEIAQQVPGVLGARMMGGGFGGCTINLVRNSAIETLSQAVAQQYQARTGYQASVDICRAAGGPGWAFFNDSPS